jgi:putative oxidoreductase
MHAPGLTILRLAVGAVFVAHGLHVLFGIGGGAAPGPGGLEVTAARLQTAGVGSAHVVAVIAGVLQFVGGALLAAGWLTRWAGVALALHTGVFAWLLHYRWGFFLNWTGAPGAGHGVEYAVVLAAALVCLAIGGGGDWSIDGRRAHREASRMAGRARAMRRG